MKRIYSQMAFVIGAAVLSASTHAACGGGGYKNVRPEVRQETRVVSRVESRDNQQDVRVVSGDYRPDSRSIGTDNTQGFDSQFQLMSGRLHLTNDQYNRAMDATRDIRSRMNDRQLNFDPKREMDQRLAQILTADQMATYLSVR